jgi:hypothetical protein
MYGLAGICAFGFVSASHKNYKLKLATVLWEIPLQVHSQKKTHVSATVACASFAVYSSSYRSERLHGVGVGGGWGFNAANFQPQLRQHGPRCS